MPPYPNTPNDGHEHVSVEPRPGYDECELCGRRWIHRSVFADGIMPTAEDISWLHHGNMPSSDTPESS